MSYYYRSIGSLHLLPIILKTWKILRGKIPSFIFGILSLVMSEEMMCLDRVTGSNLSRHLQFLLAEEVRMNNVLPGGYKLG